MILLLLDDTIERREALDLGVSASIDLRLLVFAPPVELSFFSIWDSFLYNDRSTESKLQLQISLINGVAISIA